MSIHDHWCDFFRGFYIPITVIGSHKIEVEGCEIEILTKTIRPTNCYILDFIHNNKANITNVVTGDSVEVSISDINSCDDLGTTGMGAYALSLEHKHLGAIQVLTRNLNDCLLIMGV